MMCSSESTWHLLYNSSSVKAINLQTINSKELYFSSLTYYTLIWMKAGRVLRLLDLKARGCGLKSRSDHQAGVVSR